MPYTVNKLPNEPIIVIEMLPGGNMIEEIPGGVAEIGRLLDEQVTPVFLIHDVRAMLTVSLDEMVKAASMSSRGQNALLHHPKIRENVFIITNKLAQTAVRGLESASFGRVRMHSADTVEEALAYCRVKISREDAEDPGAMAAGA